MKNILRKIKKIFFLGIILLILTGIIFYAYGEFYERNILLEIENDPAVLKAESLGLSGGVFFNYKRNYYVYYNDGGKIVISNVNKWGKERKDRPMNFYFINDYYVWFYNKDDKKFTSLRRLDIWSTIIGAKLESIVDIVKHYDLFKEHMEKSIDMFEYKQEGDLMRETAERIATNNLYLESVMINGQEIILLKCHNPSMWPLARTADLW
jgi:hypothetical protein